MLPSPALPDLAATFDAAFSVVQDIRSIKPFDPVVLVVPRGETGRALARRMATSGKPWLNVRVETPDGLFRRLVEPVLIGKGIPFLREDEAERKAVAKKYDGQLKIYEEGLRQAGSRVKEKLLLGG